MLLAAARGNPLALLELPAALTDRQLQGAEPIVGPPPARGAVEESFRARVSALPAAVRRALLLAAADQVGDLATLERALARSGLPDSTLESAREAGLVQLNGTLAFRHPLVRSAVYGYATRNERRAAHETLAEVMADPIGRAWHRALTSEQEDEAIAGELDAAGAQAAARGAFGPAPLRSNARRSSAKIPPSEDNGCCGPGRPRWALGDHRRRSPSSTGQDR